MATRIHAAYVLASYLHHTLLVPYRTPPTCFLVLLPREGHPLYHSPIRHTATLVLFHSPPMPDRKSDANAILHAFISVRLLFPYLPLTRLSRPLARLLRTILLCSQRDSPTTTLCRDGGPGEIHRQCVTVSSLPPADRSIVLPPHAAAQYVTHGVVPGNAGMPLWPSVPTSDSSVCFRIRVSSVRCLPIHLGPISCVIKSRVRVNVLRITITIICSLHSRHQFQAVHGVPFYGVLPRVLGDAALHASRVWPFPVREMLDDLL